MLALGGTVQSLGSEEMRSFPFFFGTVTMELIHAVGEVTGTMTSCCSRSSKASFTFVLSATSTRRGACCIGSTALWYSPASFPTPSQKTCG